MVEERTRNFFGAIEEGAVGPSWQAARAGYSAYAVTRNALIGIGKLLTYGHGSASTFLGGVAIATVDPGLVQTKLWMEFFLEESQIDPLIQRAVSRVENLDGVRLSDDLQQDSD